MLNRHTDAAYRICISVPKMIEICWANLLPAGCHVSGPILKRKEISKAVKEKILEQTDEPPV